MRSRLLLDTHCWLWLQTEPGRIAAGVLERLADPRVELLLSVASAWEIAIKHALGKLPLPEPPQSYVPRRLRDSDVAELPIEAAHALQVSSLPLHHQDPFDRLLVAQAQQVGATLVTVDRRLEPYDVPILWADLEPDPVVHEPPATWG